MTSKASQRSPDPILEVPREAPPSVVERISDTWGLSRVAASLVVDRLGCDADDDTIRRFLHPRFKHLHDPYALAGMTDAVDRLVRAIYDREPVTIFGDYDVDGTCSTTMLVSTLSRLGVQTEWRVPHRETDGYGLSDRGVELVRETAGRLVITVDCGVTSVDQVDALNADGRDVIIVDHHEPAERLPEAVAVLDPKRKDCSYPFDGLAAVGMTFKLIQALEDVLGTPPGTLTLPVLDLVALGTAADIVPMRDENRVLMRAGLRKLSKSPRTGIEALISVAGLDTDHMTTSSVVFGLAPRINAAGRMGSAGVAIDLLLSDDYSEALDIARTLDAANQERQAEDKRTLEAATLEAEEQIAAGAKALVLADADWHPGVVGIVAARLVERFYLPTVMIVPGEPVGRGSGRSVEGFDLHAALGECADHLEGYGGHVRAAGLSIATDKVPAFRERFQQVAAERLDDEMLRPRQKVDVVASLDEVSMEMIGEIERLGPFGPENRRPVFLSRGVTAAAPPEILKRTHLKGDLRAGSAIHEFIAFGMADRAELFDGPVDISYVPELNTFRGRTRMQLRVKAVRAAE
jgi:single-stranded-DNA-specific exonuclease